MNSKAPDYSYIHQQSENTKLIFNEGRNLRNSHSQDHHVRRDHILQKAPMSTARTVLSGARGGEPIKQTSSQNQGRNMPRSQWEYTRRIQVKGIEFRLENCTAELGPDSRARQVDSLR